jgi:hypothetical protein
MRDYSIKITLLMGLKTLFSSILPALALPNEFFPLFSITPARGTAVSVGRFPKPCG